MPLVFCFYISRPGYLFNAPFNCAQRLVAEDLRISTLVVAGGIFVLLINWGVFCEGCDGKAVKVCRGCPWGSRCLASGVCSDGCRSRWSYCWHGLTEPEYSAGRFPVPRGAWRRSAAAYARWPLSGPLLLRSPRCRGSAIRGLLLHPHKVFQRTTRGPIYMHAQRSARRIRADGPAASLIFGVSVMATFAEARWG